MATINSLLNNIGYTLPSELNLTNKKEQILREICELKISNTDKYVQINAVITDKSVISVKQELIAIIREKYPDFKTSVFYCNDIDDYVKQYTTNCQGIYNNFKLRHLSTFWRQLSEEFMNELNNHSIKNPKQKIKNMETTKINNVDDNRAQAKLNKKMQKEADRKFNQEMAQRQLELKNSLQSK